MPHAWRAVAQTVLLRRQLEAMPDGGLVVMSAPADPFRCPPGPYERASLIAHYLKTRKPKSKLLLLDAKDAFSKQRLFTDAWKKLYPDIIEWVPLSKGGKVNQVEPSTMTLVTDFGQHKAAVANVIPPQKAGAIATQAGVANNTGWCPVYAATFEIDAGAQHPCRGRCRHHGRDAEVCLRRRRAGQGDGEGDRRQARGPRTGGAASPEHLLQPDRTGVRHHRRGRLSARQGPARRHPGRRRHQSGRCRRCLPGARGAVRRGLVQDQSPPKSSADDDSPTGHARCGACRVPDVADRAAAQPRYGPTPSSDPS